VDEYVADGARHGANSDDEYSADTFAASLLMPRPAVLRRCEVRNFDASQATSLQLFQVAGELDVGYETLLTHLRYGLHLVDDSRFKELQRISPKEMRSQILGDNRGGRVVVVDRAWPAVPVDLEVGDWVAVPQPSRATSSYILPESHTNDGWTVFSAAHAGRDRFEVDGENYAVRIARAGYVGSLKYRYLDDPEES
jgi:hypothetical protein